MSKYQAWHTLEGERVMRALKGRDVKAVCIAADGQRRPFGSFTRRDLDYWRQFMEDRMRLAAALAAHAESIVEAIEAEGVDTLAEAPAPVRARFEQRERALVDLIELYGPIHDSDTRVVDGRLELAVSG